MNRKLRLVGTGYGLAFSALSLWCFHTAFNTDTVLVFSLCVFWGGFFGREGADNLHTAWFRSV